MLTLDVFSESSEVGIVEMLHTTSLAVRRLLANILEKNEE